MSDRPTPETDHLENSLGEAARMSHPILWANSRRLERERDEAREALADWENAAAHVEADHPDEKHCGCVHVLRKLLTDARKERDELREVLKTLAQHGESEIQRLTKERDEWAAMCGRYKREREEAREKLANVNGSKLMKKCRRTRNECNPK